MYHVPQAAYGQDHPRYVLWGHEHMSRPTTSFARGCKLWSRERQFYEDERHSNMAQFWDRPYLLHQYPNLDKHYPGTWRVVSRNGTELQEIVSRLAQPTQATRSRSDDIQQHVTRFRLLADREKSKDIVFRASSASGAGTKSEPPPPQPLWESRKMEERGEQLGMKGEETSSGAIAGNSD